MMMIQGGMPPMGMMGQGSGSLSSDQKQGLDDVLSNYDTKNLSYDDAKAVVEAIKELGVRPGHGLAQALNGLGIDARELAQKAGLGAPGEGDLGGGKGPGGTGGPSSGGGPGGPGGPGGSGGAQGPDSAAVQTLQSVVEQLQESLSESDDDTTDFTSLLLEKLDEAGVDTSAPIVDFRV
ncbi:hypothetical protein [uncultured Pelagimonas sp.]|uniref:hypothetical protein n=1 Tax=uncultured Pelagimonas sp. TaxID=1618102 RepID=UPI0026138288|nr:hypothetical protein [uncultured Pelagimonas sp.]